MLEPIPQFELAAGLLGKAADEFLQGSHTAAWELIASANLKEISDYAVRIVGKLSQEVHRQTRRPKCLPPAERHSSRMPGHEVQLAIFVRDGWRCRFCGIRVVSKAARTHFCKAFPIGTRWNSHRLQRHAALYAMAASLDHVLPHGRGGTNEPSNLVTACYCCQFGRGEWLLEEVEVDDPRHRPPIIDDWDGLMRLVIIRAKRPTVSRN